MKEPENKNKPTVRLDRSMRPEKAAEKQRLADALRENLKRRKGRGRARAVDKAPA